jgi:hypothetical protein
MKTAKLKIYPMWGTPQNLVVQISYRGRVLTYLDGHKSTLHELLGKAHTWAKNQGCTHITTQI